MKFIDYVTVEHENNRHPYLFIAPAFSGLKDGDSVIVETSRGKQLAQVKAVTTVNMEDDIADFIIKSTGATNPLKRVLQKVVYQDFEYEDEDEQSRDDSQT
jgi:hypothetical protein